MAFSPLRGTWKWGLTLTKGHWRINLVFEPGISWFRDHWFTISGASTIFKCLNRIFFFFGPWKSHVVLIYDMPVTLKLRTDFRPLLKLCVLLGALNLVVSTYVWLELESKQFIRWIIILFFGGGGGGEWRGGGVRFVWHIVNKCRYQV